MRSTLRLAMFVLALAALGLAGTARAQVATLLLKEGDPLPGGPPGHLITSISNSAVNHGGGYAFTVNTSDGVTTLSHAWGAPAGGPGALLLTEATYGIYEQTSWESFFGFGDGGQVAYSPSCTNLDTGTTGLDAVYLGTTKVMIEEEVYPHLAGYWWSFGSRPGVTADGVPYWVSGITDTQGGSTDNRGLFYGLGATPLLLGGNFVAGLPDPLSTSSTVSFDYRVSAYGSHYIAEVATVTGSSTNDNHMVIDGAVIMTGGLPVSENGLIPESVGGMPGEVWDNFDFCGILEDGRYMFTGDTGGATESDEIIVLDGKIVYREGKSVGGETLSGAIEGAYLNEDGDVAFIWDIQDNTLEALFANDVLLLKEGDPVDVDGDGAPDAHATVDNFTGISALTLADRGGDEYTRMYFTADIDFGPLAGHAAPEPGDEPRDLEAAGLEQRAVPAPTDDTREILEGAFVLTVPTAVPTYLAAFSVLPEPGAVAVAWSVAPGGATPAFRLLARQAGTEWEVPYAQTGPGVFAARDDRAAPGEVTYALLLNGSGGWNVLEERTITVALPVLATALRSVHPNPFNPDTRIAFGVASPQRIRIAVFDAGGRLLATLADQVYGAGEHHVDWNGRDRTGRAVASGTYLVTLEADGARDVRKLMLVR